MADFDRESMLEMFIFESNQNLEALEQCIIQREESVEFKADEINEIFRIMHTLKGSAAMMAFNSIASVAHAVEDLFFYIREENPQNVDYSRLTDIVLEGQDFIKNEISKVEAGETPDGDGTNALRRIKDLLAEIKGEKPKTLTGKTGQAAKDKPANSARKPKGVKKYYRAKIYFEDGSEMENVRAYTIVHNLKEIAEEILYEPEDIMDADTAIEVIRHNGFHMYIASEAGYDELKGLLMETVYLKSLAMDVISYQDFLNFENGVPLEDIVSQEENEIEQENLINMDLLADLDEKFEGEEPEQKKENNIQPKDVKKHAATQQMISVNIGKLDSLLNLMGELVIAEAMVTQNPELEGLQLEGFNKAARQLHKIINDVQDIVMSIRMVPLSTTFYKMNRIVRDMCKQLGKEVLLEIVGEETEVDKNIIEHISDPLMHIIRNSVDHGIEMPDIRRREGKPERGTVRLEAKNAGGDVLIIVEDDGEGLNKHRILEKAKRNGLLRKPEDEYTDKEIHSFVFMPGFSTNENVTEFSGRGVGMDVAVTNLSEVGGTILVDSIPGEGSVFTLKIPLTLAIIEGMLIKMGTAKYTIPIASIIESFKAKKENLFYDPDGNEMIMVRGESYNVVRMHDFFDITTDVTDIEDGILIMLEHNEKSVCLFADDIIGQQQVVVKTMPKYIKTVNGISGCTLLGNGDISLIVDISSFFNN